jgi:hypothetical protein
VLHDAQPSTDAPFAARCFDKANAMKTVQQLLSALTFGLVACFSAPALASTPDGVPPAFEDVCDGEQGKANGLCTAYCEAMDCDSDPNASENACNQLESRWQTLTGRTMPCETTCPCADYLGWANAYDFTLDEGWAWCIETPEATSGYYNSYVEYEWGYFGVGYDDDGTMVCVSYDDTGYEHVALPITEEQYAACSAEVVDWAASIDVTCSGE